MIATVSSNFTEGLKKIMIPAVIFDKCDHWAKSAIPMTVSTDAKNRYNSDCLIPQTEKIKMKVMKMSTIKKIFLMIFPRVFCNKLLVTVRLINFEIPNRRRKNRTMAMTVSRILISTKSIVFFIKNRKVFYRKTTRIKEFSKPLYFQTPALETLKTG